MDNKNLHAGHRQRVIKDFLEHGFNDNTPFHKVVEMLLFYCIPRKDTNDIAHLIEMKFKNFEGLFEATPEELREIDGLGDNAVAFFKLLIYVTSRYRSEHVDKKKIFNTYKEIADFLVAKYVGETKEVFSITTLSNKHQFLGYDVIKKGDVSSVGVSVREIIGAVLKRNATNVIISHNHPSGNALPSPDDVALTERIAEALANIDVRLIDHVIIAENDYVSLAQSQNYMHIFRN